MRIWSENLRHLGISPTVLFDIGRSGPLDYSRSGPFGLCSNVLLDLDYLILVTLVVLICLSSVVIYFVIVNASTAVASLFWMSVPHLRLSVTFQH